MNYIMFSIYKCLNLNDGYTNEFKNPVALSTTFKYTTNYLDVTSRHIHKTHRRPPTFYFIF